MAVDGGAPHPVVVRRLADSVETAAERLLVGRDSDTVARAEPALVAVLREVLDRVLRGYRVAELGFLVGTTTVVQVRLQPVPPVVPDAPVALTMPGIHDDVQPLVRALLDPVIPEIGRLPAFVPVEALDWAGPLLERRATELVEGAVVGFSGSARIEAAPDWRVAIMVVPRDARLVRDLGVRFRSASIPFVLLDQHTPQVTSMAEPLRGLPVAFAAAHRSRLEALLTDRLNAYPPARQYGVVAHPSLQVAEVTHLTVVADSTLYRARLEARLTFGTYAPVPDVRAQIGRAFGALEPFVELTLIPSNLAWRWAVGLRVEAGTHLVAGFVHRFEGGGPEPFLSVRLSPDLWLGGAYAPHADLLETTLTYRVNEFLSWEAVATSRGLVWVRLVSHL